MDPLALMRKVRLRTFARTFIRGKVQQRLRYVFGMILVGIVFLAVFGLSLGSIGAILRLEGGEELVDTAPAAVYTFALVFVGLATALYTMYLSKDLDLLASMPIGERTVCAYKFWETLLRNSAVFVILALPAPLVYGVVTGTSALFYPAVLVVSALILMIPTRSSVALVMPLMRLILANKAKEIVSALGILVGISSYVAQLWFVGRPSRTGGGHISPLQTFSGASVLNVPPGSWASDTVTGVASSEWGRLLSGLVSLTALAIVIYVVCLSLTGWAYATGRARAAESGGRVHTSGWTGRLLGWLPQDIQAVAAKDLTLLLRDLQRLALMRGPRPCSSSSSS